MRKLAPALVAAAMLLVTAWPSEAGGIRPGYYGYSLLVYGHAERLYASGCLRWGWQNRAWYNYCCASCGYGYTPARRAVVSAKY